MPGPYRRKLADWPVAGFVTFTSAPGGDELLDGASTASMMLADQRDGRLNFRDDAHVPQQLFGAAQILAHREVQRQTTADVGVDVRFAMLDLVGVDRLAVDVIGQHGLDVARIGENAELGGGVGGLLGRRGNLARLYEADARRAVGGEEESQKHFAIAVAAEHDLLLPPLPAVGLNEIIEHVLHGCDPRRRNLRLPAFFSGAALYVCPGADGKEALMRFSWPLMANSLPRANRRH